MYSTYVPAPPSDATLRRLDDALLRLRRLWAPPPAASFAVETGADGARVAMSTVLVVEACGQAAGEVAVTDVARFLAVEHSTASRLVERAVRGGYVSRGRSATDARRVALTLTGSGRALRERAIGFRTQWLRDTIPGWDGQEVAELAGLLARFADDVGRAAPPGP